MFVMNRMTQGLVCRKTPVSKSVNRKFLVEAWKGSSNPTILDTLNNLNNILWHILEPHHDKTNKMSVRPAKTQISLSVRPV